VPVELARDAGAGWTGGSARDRRWRLQPGCL